MLFKIDIAQGLHTAHRAGVAFAFELLRRRRRFGPAQIYPGQRIPRVAGHALALPLGMFSAAVVADVGGFGFGHGVSYIFAAPVR